MKRIWAGLVATLPAMGSGYVVQNGPMPVCRADQVMVGLQKAPEPVMRYYCVDPRELEKLLREKGDA